MYTKYLKVLVAETDMKKRKKPYEYFDPTWVHKHCHLKMSVPKIHWQTDEIVHYSDNSSLYLVWCSVPISLFDYFIWACMTNRKVRYGIMKQSVQKTFLGLKVLTFAQMLRKSFEAEKGEHLNGLWPSKKDREMEMGPTLFVFICFWLFWHLICRYAFES